MGPQSGLRAWCEARRENRKNCKTSVSFAWAGNAKGGLLAFIHSLGN